MIGISADFQAARNNPRLTELIALEITNAFGQRLFSDIHPTEAMLALSGPNLADGTYLADGSILAGADSLALLGYGAWVSQWGTIRRETGTDPLRAQSALEENEAASMTVTLDNRNNRVAKIIAIEGLLGATAKVRVGYPGVAAREFLTPFTGIVDSWEMNRQSCVLQLVSI